jgi:hypothetical protein
MHALFLGLISSVANHQMQQLLSKYLLLLLSSPKAQINGNKIISIAMSTSISNSPHSTNINSFFLLHYLGSKTITSDISEVISPRENVETFVLIWFDMATNKNEDTIIFQSKLRAIINSLFIFHTIDETINFIKNIKEEKVFLILSDLFEWELIERIEMNKLSQLDSIYIFYHDKSKHKTLTKRDDKIRGIFTDIDSLCIRLKEDLKQSLNDLLPISVAPNASNKNKSTTDKEKQVAFLCAQLHRELLFTMEYPDDAQLDLIEYCMNIYKDNETEREFIEELRDEYDTGKAIWW